MASYQQPRRPWRHSPPPRPPAASVHQAQQGQWHADPGIEALDLLPGITFYFPPRQMRRMRAAYTRARRSDPGTYSTFHHFVLTRVSQGLADRCISLAPGTDTQGAPTAGAFLAMQLQLAARQLGVDQQTLLYGLVAPEDALHEQRWQALRAWCAGSSARSVSARWGRRGCTASLVGLGALGLLLCCLLGVVEAIAALLVQHPH
jgi:hypothetical protein